MRPLGQEDDVQEDRDAGAWFLLTIPLAVFAALLGLAHC
jgi:hypothetical protein